MGWADYISPDDVAEWEKANNSKLIYDNYASMMRCIRSCSSHKAIAATILG